MIAKTNTSMFPHYLPLTGLPKILVTVTLAAVAGFELGPATWGAVIAGATGGAIALLLELLRRGERRDIRLEAQEHRIYEQQLQFLQAQISYRTQLETLARNRMHRATGELQHALLHIQKLELCDDSPRKSIEPFRIKSQAEIFGVEDLPVAPVFTNITSLTPKAE